MTPANITIGVDENPPPLQYVLLALQYAFLLSMYLVLVVIVVHAAKASPDTARSVISMAMIASAVGTVLQAFHRGPVGSGYLAPPVFSAIYLGPSILAAKAGGLPAVACMTVCAGLFEMLIAGFLHRLRIIMQPIISGLIICIIALELGIVGLQHLLDVGGENSPQFSSSVAAATLTLSVCVGFAVWGKGVWRLICSLLGLLAGVALAAALGLFDNRAVSSLEASPWFALPDLSYVSAVHWELGLMPAFLAAGMAAAIRTVGVVTTCQRANNANWIRPDFINIRKGVIADGLGCTIGGLVGAPGMNIGPSLVGVSIATGVTSRSIAYGTAVVLLILAFMPKVADVFLQLPLPVAGALLVFTACIMLVSGLQLLMVKALDMRLTFVVGLGLLFPLVQKMSQAYFDAMPGWLSPITNSGLALGLTSAIGLLLIFRIATDHQQTILWNQSADAVGELKQTLEKNAQAWGLTSDVISRAMSNIVQVVELLKEGRLMVEPVAIRARERDNSLEVELRYRGAPLFLSSAHQSPTMNEESSMSAGLQDVAIGVFADRISTSMRGRDVILQLRFDM